MDEKPQQPNRQPNAKMSNTELYMFIGAVLFIAWAIYDTATTIKNMRPATYEAMKTIGYIVAFALAVPSIEWLIRRRLGAQRPMPLDQRQISQDEIERQNLAKLIQAALVAANSRGNEIKKLIATIRIDYQVDLDNFNLPEPYLSRMSAKFQTIPDQFRFTQHNTIMCDPIKIEFTYNKQHYAYAMDRLQLLQHLQVKNEVRGDECVDPKYGLKISKAFLLNAAQTADTDLSNKIKEWLEGFIKEAAAIKLTTTEAKNSTTQATSTNNATVNKPGL